MTSSQDLTAKRCEPCEGGVDPLAADAVAELMNALNEDWQVSEDGKSISRDFEFAGY